MDYQETYRMWTTDNYFDKQTRDELLSIANDPKEIEDRFHKNLEFGTGGLRGVIGAGTNRMNIYTIRMATQGLANYILKQDPAAAAMGVCIAYDSRRMSVEFAEETALVLCGNGIKAYVFASLRPTPVLSFALRELGCTAGIVITASHNPPEYNGYKAYWQDGAQMAAPRDVEVIEEVNRITGFNQIHLAQKAEAIAGGLYHTVDPAIDEAYANAVLNQSITSNIPNLDQLSVIYTPLHGSGNIPVRQVLKKRGFTVHVVPEQEKPDPDFSTVGYPNPEDPKAFAMALALAKEKKGDIVIATDPDCDRVGVALPDPQGNYINLTGNQVGILLADYILSRKQTTGQLPENGAIISTIVSTNMTKALANHYHVTFMEVLTGFKYIGEKIKEFEATGSHQFLLGFEESIGYLVGTYTRDKDAVVASMLICEAAAYYRSQGATLLERLESLYGEYGYYMESNHSITMTGLAGAANIQKIMDGLRAQPLDSLLGSPLYEIRDYEARQQTVCPARMVKPLDLPVSNVLYYTMADGTWYCVRPSGTEPKVKIYFGVKGSSREDAQNKMNQTVQVVMDYVQKLIQ